MEFPLSVTIGYLLGSIPTAFLIVKAFKGIDILKVGSGNVGTLNTIRTTNSKFIGLIVLLIDAIKGSLSAFIPLLFFPDIFIYPAMALLFAVFAHCFNPWLGFRGGRGLAVAAGGGLIIFPYIVITWIVLWVIFFLMKKNHHIANIASTILTLLLLFNTVDIAIKFSTIQPESTSSLLVIVAAILILIFIKHIDPLNEIISNQKSKRVIKND